MAETQKSETKFIVDEQQARIDLAALLRYGVGQGYQETNFNHFSYALDEEGKQFLLNPKWKCWENIGASDLVLCDADAKYENNDAVDIPAWTIHGAMHRLLPRARVVLHCHPPWVTALGALRDPTLYPVDQNSAAFFNRIAYQDYSGIVQGDDEGEQIARAFGNHNIMMHCNHGVTIIGTTPAMALTYLFYVERAAMTLMMAYSSNQPLKILDDKTAEYTAAGWETYDQQSFEVWFEEEKIKLDRTQPDYKD